jgi:hypothetical protein
VTRLIVSGEPLAMRRRSEQARGSGDTDRTRLTSVRRVAIGLAVAMVAAGIWVIVTDRPSGKPGNNLIGLNEQCSASAHIGVSNYDVKLDLTTSGYWIYGHLTVTRLPRGNGRCQFAASIPDDATLVYEKGFHIESTSATPQVISAVASISGTSDLRPPAEIGFQYFSPSVERDGWGETSFTLSPRHLPGQTGELISAASGKVVFGSQSVSLPEDVTVSCPPGSNTVRAYPADAIQTDLVDTSWTGLQQGTFLDVLCQNPQVRFWVDHATDLIVLGLGAILGVLAAIDPRLRRRQRVAPPLNATSATTTAPLVPGRVVTSIIGIALLAAMIRRARPGGVQARRGIE